MGDDHEVSVPGAEHRVEVEMPKGSVETNTRARLSCDRVCTFSRQEESACDSKSRAKLCSLVIFYLIVMAVEIVGGLKANSLAILTDAAHLLTDIAGFALSIFTLWASGWDATSRQSFGFKRAEVLGALLSLQLIWVISGFLIYEALDRILQKHEEVDGELMFAIAAFGFLINFVMVMWIGHDHSHGHTCMTPEDHDHEKETLFNHGDHDHDHCHNARDHEKEEEEITRIMSSPSEQGRSKKKMNINVKGAYLHVMSDMIQSIGVMIAGLVIWANPHWLLVDLICTIIFSVFSLCTTLPMLTSIFSILMERTPSEVNVARLEVDLKCIDGLKEVHDLHVWAITVEKFVLACHVIVEPRVDSGEILHKIRDLCERKYGINHVTVQIEHD